MNEEIMKIKAEAYDYALQMREELQALSSELQETKDTNIILYNAIIKMGTKMNVTANAETLDNMNERLDALLEIEKKYEMLETQHN